MFSWIIKKIIGSKNQREIRRMLPMVTRINEIEQTLQSLPDEALREKTLAWKQQLSMITDSQELAQQLELLLPEAFAVVKNAARRLCGRQFTVCDQETTWNMVHFDVQLIGGMVLHQGRIAEMATGEGKTLVATLPIYLNALTGRGVHLVTVNDYLARRDAECMGQLYSFLGLTVGIIEHDQSPEERRAQYECDITYGTNSEFGFDYLRDNGMATNRDQQVQRGHYFSIVDEVDSILIDEARTPLIISGPATVSTHQYDLLKPLVSQLIRKQSMLCARLVAEAKEFQEKGEKEKAGLLLFKVKLGQPRNKGLLRMMEDHEMRKFIDKAELSFYQESSKDSLVALKEELFFSMEERQHEADLTELGRDFLNPDDPNAFVLPDLLTEFADIEADETLSESEKNAKKLDCQQHCDQQAERMHNIAQLLKAYCLYEKDVEYVVEENKVVIVDTFTGRKMAGRRWSDGLHQAVEAKEGVQIDRETQTLATITIQNYFRLYEKLAGMTGTAETEANEFHDIYGLDVSVIPTNQPVRRVDQNDRIYKTRREKYAAVIAEITASHGRGQPVLVGTASVEASELVSRMLKREKIPHTVLNAKFHMQEAEIIARAGLQGAVTISTNMAGRGTDIKLGEGVSSLGGLFVIGTERHESRRIDRQLRGRCARQGDPGLSRFYVSFEDDLMRNFGASDRMTKIMERFGIKEGEELEHPWLNRSVETAQKRVEQRNYLMRRRTLEFDDVMNQQREVIYGYRNEVMDAENPCTMIHEVIEEMVPKKVASFLGIHGEEVPDVVGLLQWISTTFPVGLSSDKEVEKTAWEQRTLEENSTFLTELLKNSYDKKVGFEGQNSNARSGLERYVILNAIDRLWQEHLYAMDGLREAVYLRAYGQKDPLTEYKTEAYTMFVELMHAIKEEVLNNLFKSTVNLQAFETLLANLPHHLIQADPSGKIMSEEESSRASEEVKPPEPSSAEQLFEKSLQRELPKIGRNDTCLCGSGKKFKSCCGRMG
ncbi:MAG: preprotein translocase subunit SecA [Verrucomicrobia bacterium RIFCSPHIGHO2_12_FULL_41_10]|nr:MAG: preprotein translocase subunit SecA [Verrucomicrobia bacterium RIFCSPHIGHO2_12_FULL_41_10]HLB33277.1 preprotein translocase subunit SecA [Chthoniobacterales bacterium]